MKISRFKKFIFAALSASLFFIACEKENSADDDFAIVSLSANGSSNSKTTKINFTVSNDKFTLTADDIIINAVFYVMKGELKKTGATAYELPITPGGTGTIRVGLNPYNGFTGWNAKTATVYADNYFSGTSELTITGGAGYRHSDGSLEIPLEINRMPVTKIGGSAFLGKGLIEVTIPDSVTNIGESAFAHNQLSKIEIPVNVVSIGSTAFAYNQLSAVTIPNSVTSIGSGAFGYNQLTSFTIPENVTYIANSTFAYNQLTSITIPKKVKTIGNDAFLDNRLTELIIIEDIEDVNYIGITSIGNGAFSYNRLTSITLPKNLTSIGNGAFSHNELTSITIPKNVSSVSGFNNNELTKVEFVFEIVNETVDGVVTEVKKYKVTTIGHSAFAYNELKKIDIPGSVTDIGYRAFAYNKLSKVIIPDSVRNIEIHAFIDNPLTSITIGERVTLGSSAFGNGFEKAYYDNSRAKGTYIRDNIDSKTWTKKEDGEGEGGEEGGNEGEGGDEGEGGGEDE